MSRILNDSDGDSLRIEKAAPPYEGVVLSASQRGDGDTLHHAIFGPINPHVLIEAIKAECEMHEDDEVHDSPVVEETARQINAGHFVVHENGRTIPLGRDEHGRFIPATAEAPRLWAGADEPIIDQLIGRVADLEDEQERTEAHGHLAEHWNRRLDVARSAISMTPRRGESKPVGIMAAFGGTERSGEVSVTDALKIARFAADEDRDIPGVDS